MAASKFDGSFSRRTGTLNCEADEAKWISTSLRVSFRAPHSSNAAESLDCIDCGSVKPSLRDDLASEPLFFASPLQAVTSRSL